MAAVTLTDITTAITNNSVCLRVPELQTAQPLKYKGRVVCYSGNYGAVYKFVLPNGEEKAVRIWTKDLSLLPELPLRAKTISNYIKKSNSSFFSAFDFYENGILVGGSLLPLVVMKWETGKPLKEFIEYHLHDAKIINQLANNFLAMIKEMHSMHISHGDLQHGNILVDEKCNIKLIDYDSIYIPHVGFDNKIEEIKGLPDYQHPARQSNKYMTEKADYFSELVIYISIMALSKKPDLWSIYNVANRDYSLLFDSKDFGHLEQSNIYKDIINIDAIFKALLVILKLYLSKPSIEELEPFDVLLERMTKDPAIHSFTCSRKQGLYVGDRIALSWTTSDAQSTTVNGEQITETSCERTLSFVGNNTFTLKASNGFNSAEKRIEVNAFPIPGIIFAADKTKLHATTPEEIVLSWNVQYAKEVVLVMDGTEQNVESCGKQKTTPQKSTVYLLKATGIDGARTFEKDVEIQVYEEAKVSFASDKENVLEGYPVKLEWEVENATKVELEGDGIVPENSSIIVKPASSTIYVLKVTDHFGVTKEHKVHISTIELPKIIFESNKKKINIDKKEKAKITWFIENANKATIILPDEEIEVKLKGNKEIAVTEDAEIKLCTTALDNETVFTNTITILALEEAKIEFDIDKPYTIPNVPIEVSWSVQNAKEVELVSVGKVKPVGTHTFTISKDTTFVLRVTDEFQKTEKRIDARVLPLPIIKSINVPIPEINNELNIKLNIPKYDNLISIPNISVPGVNFEMPKGQEMEKVFDGINNLEHTGVFAEFKSLFSYYFKKIRHDREQ